MESEKEYPKVFKLNTKSNSKFLPILGFLIVIAAFTIWGVAFYYLFKGGILSRSIIILLMVIQYSTTEKSYLFLSLLRGFNIPSYFNSVELILEEELKDSGSLFCCHSHGILPFGVGLCYLSGVTAMSKAETLGTRFVGYLPVSGLLARWMGLFGVDPKNFEDKMKKNKNILFAPGGYEEATITSNYHDRVFIKNRKGFIKMALKYGYRVYQLYTFNENKVFHTIGGFEKIGILLNKIKIPGCAFYGEYLIFPRSEAKLYTVIGKAFNLPKIEDPSPEDVTKYHDLYVQYLVELYNRHKLKYEGNENLELF